MKKIACAVIGIGHLGAVHTRIYAEHPQTRLLCVVDKDESRAQKAAKQYGVQALTDYHEIPKEVEAVSVVTPTSTHYRIASDLLQKGCHMLLEKPIAPTVEEGEALVRLAQDRGVIFMVGHLERFNAAVQELFRRVKKPRFIQAQRIGKFVPRALDTDVVTDLMIHDLDIILSLIDAPVVRTSTLGARVLSDQLDMVNTRLEFDNKAIADITASRVANRRYRRMRVFSDDTYHTLDFVKQKLFEVKRITENKQSRIVSEQIVLHPKPQLETEMDHFIECLIEQKEPVISPQSSVEALRIARKLVHDVEGF